jgi:uncharacterized delta-60 repeat protein/uncharacterized repeat protein (TIGR01451 family)
MLSRRKNLTGIKRRGSMMRYARPLLALTLVLTVVVGVLRKAEAADGDLDPTFNTDGKVTTDFPNQPEQGQAIAIQADGKSVVAGYSTFSAPGAAAGSDRDFAVVRYDTNGNLDNTFGKGGTVTIDFFKGSSDEANAVAIQADGKIVLGGFTDAKGTIFALARLNTDGSLDDGSVSDSTPGDQFGTDEGRVVTFFTGNDVIHDLAIQTDGRIVAAGRVGFSADGLQQGGVVNGTTSIDFAIARYNTDGSLDDGSMSDSTPGDEFGVDGLARTDFSTDSDDEAYGVVIQTNGKIVAAGRTQDFVIIGDATSGGTGSDFALARYNTDGSLDDGTGGDSTPGDQFGQNGTVITDFFALDDQARDVKLQTDGKIVAGGWASMPSGSVAEGIGDMDFAAARYNTDGSLDTTGPPPVALGGDTFDDGKVTTDINGQQNQAYGLDIQADGKIILAGFTNVLLDGIAQTTEGASDHDFALVRYNTNGSLDDGTGADSTPGDEFGTDGIVTTDFFGNVDEIRDIAIQEDGKIVAAGFAFNQPTLGGPGFGFLFAAARYLAASADLSVDVTDNVDPVLGGKNIIYKVKVTNNGPSTANNVVLVNRTPRGGQFVSVTTNHGTCSEEDTIVTCDLGNLNNGQMAIVNITIRTLTVNNTISEAEGRVSADEPDPDLSNNTDFESTRVIDLRKLSFSPPIVTGGCQHSVGTLLLTSAAPEMGLKLNLSDNSASTDIPSMITVPAGQLSVQFNVTTHMVTSERIVTIKAFMGTNSIEGRIKLLPVRISSLTFSPNPVHGGMTATGTVTLACATDQNVVVKLSSNKSAAKPAVTQITIPAGQTSGQFQINTLHVNSNRDVTFTAMANGASKTAVLHVVP